MNLDINQKINYRSNCGPKTKANIKEKYQGYIDTYAIVRPKHEGWLASFSRRTAMNLPVGNYKLTDGIYTYTLRKYENTGENCLLFSIYDDMTYNQHIAFFLRSEDLFEKDEWREISKHGNPKIPTLSCLSTVGGMSVHSNETFNCLNRMNLLPKSSFQEYLKKEIK